MVRAAWGILCDFAKIHTEISSILGKHASTLWKSVVAGRSRGLVRNYVAWSDPGSDLLLAYSTQRIDGRLLFRVNHTYHFPIATPPGSAQATKVARAQSTLYT